MAQADKLEIAIHGPRAATTYLHQIAVEIRALLRLSEHPEARPIESARVFVVYTPQHLVMEACPACWRWLDEIGRPWNYCPYCGADLRPYIEAAHHEPVP